MKEIINKISPKSRYICLYIIGLIIGLADELLIKKGILPNHFTVEVDYIYYMFSAVVTVGVLGSTLLGMVVSSSDKVYLSLSLSNILNLKYSPVNLTTILVLSLICVIMGPLLICLNLNAVMTVLLILTCFMIFCSSINIWKYVNNRDLLATIIEKEMKYDSKRFYSFIENKTHNLYEGLLTAISNEDIEMEKQYIELFVNLSKKDCSSNTIKKGVADILLGKTFPKIVEHHGFATAYELLDKYESIDIDQIIFDYCIIVQSLDDVEMNKYTLYEKLNSILIEMKIDPIKKGQIIFNLFLAIKDNSIVSNVIRFKKINEFFWCICDYLEVETCKETTKYALLNCLKISVLENGNYDEQERYYMAILDAISNRVYYGEESNFLTVIAEIFRGFYYYFEYEKETFSEEHINVLKQLLKKHISTIEKNNHTLPGIVFQNIEGIKDYYVDNLLDPYYKSYFKYIPKGHYYSFAFWNHKDMTYFAFVFYLATGDLWKAFIEIQKLSDAVVDNKYKREICKAVLMAYDFENDTLKESIYTDIENMQKLLGCQKEIDCCYIKDSITILNQYLKALNDEASDINKNVDLDVINGKLEVMALSKYQDVFDKSLPFDNCEEIVIGPILNERISEDVNYSIANELTIYIEQQISEIIKKTLRTVILSFNQNGVNELHAELSEECYKKRNYTFVDDLAISQEVRDSDLYKALKDKIENIELMSKNNFPYMFLKDELLINYKLEDFRQEEQDENLATKYIKKYQIAKGKYKIKDAVCTKSEAIEWTIKNVRIEYAVVKIVTNISNNSGFKVEFNRITCR